MQIVLVALAAACLASCTRQNSDHIEISGKPWTGPAIPRPEWRRIEARFRQASYPRAAFGVLSGFDRGTVERLMWSPVLTRSRQFAIANSDTGQHWRCIGIVLDRDVPADVSRFAATLCGEAPDLHHVRIASIEISGVLPEHENAIGNNRSVIFRSRQAPRVRSE